MRREDFTVDVEVRKDEVFSLITNGRSRKMLEVSFLNPEMFLVCT